VYRFHALRHLFQGQLARAFGLALGGHEVFNLERFRMFLPVAIDFRKRPGHYRRPPVFAALALPPALEKRLEAFRLELPRLLLGKAKVETAEGPGR